MKLLVLLALGLLVACNDKPPEKTVFDAQLQSLKKARQVEDKVRQDAERTRAAIEDAVREDSENPPASH